MKHLMFGAAMALTLSLPARAQQTTAGAATQDKPASATSEAAQPAATKASVKPADPQADRKRLDIVSGAGKLIAAGKHQQAIEALAPVIRDYEAEQAARTDTLVFSAQSQAQAIMYAVLGANQNKTTIVVGPAYAYAWFLQGYTLSELGKPQEAEAAVKRAAALSPMNPQFLAELAMLQQKRGDSATALQTFKNAEEFAGFGQEGSEKRWKGIALRGQGFVLIETGKLDEAEERFNAALKIDPDEAKAKHELEYIRDLRTKH